MIFYCFVFLVTLFLPTAHSSKLARNHASLYIIKCMERSLELLKMESEWSKFGEGVDERWKKVCLKRIEFKGLADIEYKIVFKLVPNMPKELNQFMLESRGFLEASFSQKALALHEMQKTRLVSNFDLIDQLPRFFARLTDRFPSIAKAVNEVRASYYGFMYIDGIVEGEHDALDADFCKHMIYGDQANHETTLNFLILGVTVQLSKPLVLFNKFYHHYVNELGLDFVELLDKVDFPNLRYLKIYAQFRRNVNVSFGSTDSVSAMLETARFEAVAPECIDMAPYIFKYVPLFREHLESLRSDGKLVPHPQNGKLMFTKKVIDAERNNIIKLFKIMVCMNIHIPRLSFREAEYGEGDFVFPKTLKSELLNVAVNIEAVTYHPMFKLPESTPAVFKELVNNDGDFANHLAFIISDQIPFHCITEIKSCQLTEKRMIRINRAEITVNPKMTVEEYKRLLVELGEVDGGFEAHLKPVKQSKGGQLIPKSEIESFFVESRPTATTESSEIAKILVSLSPNSSSNSRASTHQEVDVVFTEELNRLKSSQEFSFDALIGQRRAKELEYYVKRVKSQSDMNMLIARFKRVGVFERAVHGQVVLTSAFKECSLMRSAVSKLYSIVEANQYYL